MEYLFLLNLLVMYLHVSGYRSNIRGSGSCDKDQDINDNEGGDEGYTVMAKMMIMAMGL